FYVVEVVDAELATVRAHEVHLAGQAGHRGEVAQGAAGDDRGVRGRQGRERPHRVDVGVERERAGGAVDEVGDRPVVVGRDQQLRGAGERHEARVQLVTQSAGDGCQIDHGPGGQGRRGQEAVSRGSRGEVL